MCLFLITSLLVEKKKKNKKEDLDLEKVNSEESEPELENSATEEDGDGENGCEDDPEADKQQCKFDLKFYYLILLNLHDDFKARTFTCFELKYNLA